MLVWKALHVLSMFTMVATFIGAEIFYAAAMWRRDARSLAWVHRTVERAYLGFIALGGLLLGIVFGLLAAATGGFDYLAGWLIAAYVLIGAFVVNAVVYGDKTVKAGRAAIKAEDAGESLDEFSKTMDRRSGAMVLLINGVIFALIVADMVLKPF
jgi:uncharacterized membrane protein